MRFRYGVFGVIIVALMLLAYRGWINLQTPGSDHASSRASTQAVSSDAISPVVAATQGRTSSEVEKSRPDETVDKLINFLEPSAEPRDILLLLAIRGGGDKDDLDRLRRLLSTTSERAMVLYLIAKFQIDGKYVATGEELAALKDAAPNNAVVDDLLAQRAYATGDNEQALYHLQQGAKAGVSRSYQLKHLGLTGAAYLQRNGYLTVEDFIAIKGWSAAYPVPNLSFIYRVCQENATNEAWVAACGGRGQVLFDGGETTSDRAVGARLATTYLDEDLQRYRDYSTGVQEALTMLAAELDKRMVNSAGVIDQQAWRRYMEIYAEHDEIMALRYLISLFP